MPHDDRVANEITLRSQRRKVDSCTACTYDGFKVSRASSAKLASPPSFVFSNIFCAYGPNLRLIVRLHTPITDFITLVTNYQTESGSILSCSGTGRENLDETEFLPPTGRRTASSQVCFVLHEAKSSWSAWRNLDVAPCRDIIDACQLGAY
jgi:hypothetical protein